MEQKNSLYLHLNSSWRTKFPLSSRASFLAALLGIWTHTERQKELGDASVLADFKQKAE